MKSVLLLFLVVLSTLSASAQQQSQQLLKMHHPDTGETYLIQSGKVVRLVTKEGKRYKDQLTIIDENTIALDGMPILLSEIDKIKKMRNIWVYLLGTAAVYFGVLGGAVGVLLVALADSASIGLGLGLALAGVGLTYAGINGINPARGFKSYQGWQYSVVSQNDLQPTTP